MTLIKIKESLVTAFRAKESGSLCNLYQYRTSSDCRYKSRSNSQASTSKLEIGDLKAPVESLTPACCIELRIFNLLTVADEKTTHPYESLGKIRVM